MFHKVCKAIVFLEAASKLPQKQTRYLGQEVFNNYTQLPLSREGRGGGVGEGRVEEMTGERKRGEKRRSRETDAEKSKKEEEREHPKRDQEEIED